MSIKIKSQHDKFKKDSAKTLYAPFDKKKRKREERERESYLDTLSEQFQLPPDVLTCAPIVTITGKQKLCLENYQGIIEYTGDLIRIQTKHGRIHIEGKKLNIDYCTELEMHVTGYLTGIYYC